MRKSVILIISTLSLLAIILIGLIFQRAEIYNETIYIEKIVVTHIRIGDTLHDTYFDEENNLYRVLNPERTDEEKLTPLTLPYEEGLTLIIQYSVTPYVSTYQRVTFHTDANSHVASVERDSGLVTFLDEGTATFDIRAVDNASTKTKIRIRAKTLSSL